MFDTNLKLNSCFGKEGSGKGEFSYPHDLTFDPYDDVYVTDHYNHCVFHRMEHFCEHLADMAVDQVN